MRWNKMKSRKTQKQATINVTEVVFAVLHYVAKAGHYMQKIQQPLDLCISGWPVRNVVRKALNLLRIFISS